MKKFILIMCLVFSSVAWAGDETDTSGQPWWCRWWLNVKHTWESDRVELWVPVNTWHNRWIYEHSKAHTYNERPWGAGIGKYRLDEDGDRHRLAVMVFQDSHDKPEPTIGYSWQYLFRKDKTFRPTLGFMGGITFRDDYDWLPIPAILPIAGFDVGNFSVETTYIPGLGGNNGNVLFTWINWRF